MSTKKNLTCKEEWLIDSKCIKIHVLDCHARSFEYTAQVMMNIDPDARGGARTAQDETIEQQIIHPESDCKIYPVPPKNELIKQRYG